MGKTSALTTLTSKGQVVIPKALRDRLRWRSGRKLRAEVVGGEGLKLAPYRRDLIDVLMGSVSTGDPLGELEAEHRAEIEAEERGHRGR